MGIRVIVWGTGFVGKMVLEEILDHPDYEVCGKAILAYARVRLPFQAASWRMAACGASILPICSRISVMATT